MLVMSSAPDNGVSNICARVKRIEPTTPINQIATDAFRKVRSFSAEVETLPSTSSSKNAIASSAPIVAKPPSKLKYLKVVFKKFIDPQIIYVRIVKVQQSQRMREQAKQ